jgi:hypothetical protein
MAPARTGRLVMSKIAVSLVAHKNKGRRSIEMIFLVREHTTVVRKLILPRIEEIPAR